MKKGKSVAVLNEAQLRDTWKCVRILNLFTGWRWIVTSHPGRLTTGSHCIWSNRWSA